MSNPVLVPCEKDVWTLVAVGVTLGWILKRVNDPVGAKYLQTYKLTGEAAPTDNDEAGRLFKDRDYARISHDLAIDVYVKSLKIAGAVRVDL